jgi:hypothetical protein
VVPLMTCAAAYLEGWVRKLIPPALKLGFVIHLTGETMSEGTDKAFNQSRVPRRSVG